MDPAETLLKSYRSSLAMLRSAIVACPEETWYSRDYGTNTWQIAFHVLHYTDLYLSKSMESFTPWEKYKDNTHRLELHDFEPYTRTDILAYLDSIVAGLPEDFASWSLSDSSGFFWLEMDKFSLQIYNIRHIMQHTGELYERLQHTGADLPWLS